MSYKSLLFCPDERTARLVAQVLKELEFAVESANEPFAAVKKLEVERFDALIVDCQNEQDASVRDVDAVDEPNVRRQIGDRHLAQPAVC